MILVFDLDDTLYEEMSYVRSGFAAVARHAAKEWGVAEQAFLTGLLNNLEAQGRGRVFDDTLREFGVKGSSAAAQCLAVYRGHEPEITLSAEGRRALERFADVPKYLVTDGNARVQERKVRALELAPLLRKVFVTHRYGRGRSKPSPHCFLRIAERERADPSAIFYVGDNPAKDFVGIRPLGFRTIRVLQGPYAPVRAAAGHDAEVSIANLDELTWDLLHGMTSVATR